MNSTFLINTIKTDISITEGLALRTIPGVIHEVVDDLAICIEDHMDIKTIGTTKKQNVEKLMSKTKMNQLSSIDRGLLAVAYENRKNCILVTDDRQLRTVARNNKIQCMTTPLYVAYLTKKGVLDKEECVTFLSELKKIYIRPKDINRILEKMT